MRYSFFILLSLLLASCGNYQAVSEENNFSINFPMKFEHQMVPRDGYTAEVFYAFSKDSLIQYQVAVNSIPGDKKIIPDTLFKYSIMGPAGQLGAMSMDRENIEKDGHPGMRFTLLGINAASVYDMYLVDRTLYHICIIDKYPRKPTEEEVEAFMGSFELRE